MGEIEAGRCRLAIIAPERTVGVLAGPEPGSAPPQFVATAKRLLPFTAPMNITGVGFTGGRKLVKEDLLHLPFVTALLSFAYVGHNVVIFEGHPSGFTQGLAGAEALLIDSDMLPFLQSDWFEVARRAFGRKGRIRVFERKTALLRAVVPSQSPPGWEYTTEHGGEPSYVNALLTTLAKREPLEIRLDPDQPLPDPADLATDPEEIDWTSKLPFQYDALSVEEIIRIVADTPGVTWAARPDGRTAARVKLLLAGPGGKAAPVIFDFELAGDGTARQLRIRKWEPTPAPRESKS
jgi:hypothetical protein